MTVIRDYADTDAEALTGLVHRAYGALAAMGLNFTAVDQPVEVTRRRAAGGQCWVAQRDGVLVATLALSHPPYQALQDLTPEARVPGRGWLNQLAVDPAAQGTGLARALWDHALAWSAGAGLTSLGLDTAEPAEHLTAMYRGWGFQEADCIHWDGKTYDSVVMIRSVAPPSV